MVSILHISDLHRDPRHEITNDALVDSLLRDRQRYTRDENQAIKSPDLVIVSGDIVTGVRHDHPNADAEVKRQYENAHEFLSRLTDNLLGGDKERLILVPGNHDIFSGGFFASIKQLNVNRDDPGVRELVQEVFNPNSQFRWSWKCLDVFEIVNKETYLRRLEPFCEFYTRFYENQRRMDIDPTKQYDIFDYPDFNVTVAALSSCYNSDLFNRQGDIHPTCLANAGEAVNNWHYKGRLRLAVWHHNTSGGPSKNNYMDQDVLQVLIDKGFSVGFHGHQHKPQFIDERLETVVKRKMTVISAGTLCGGPSDLPSGQRRSYNILELDTQTLTGTLHLRQMQNDSFVSPVWGPATFPTSLSSFVEFDVQAPPDPVSTEAGSTRLLAEAEAKLRAGNYDEAIGILLTLVDTNELARRLFLECLGKKDGKESNELTINYFDPPRSTTELLYLIDALWIEQKRERLRELLASAQVAESSDPTTIDVRRKYLARLDS